jgi:hypothetical protein
MSDEEMDALDFVINVLREHEKNLDALISRLERILSRLPTVVEKEEIGEKAEEAKKETGAAKVPVNILCESWSDFKSACSGAEIIAFNHDGVLSIKALHGNIIYEYREALLGHTGSLQCGVPVKLQTNIDAAEIKRVLSRELKVPENRIIKGEINFPNEIRSK